MEDTFVLTQDTEITAEFKIMSIIRFAGQRGQEASTHNIGQVGVKLLSKGAGGSDFPNEPNVWFYVYAQDEAGVWCKGSQPLSLKNAPDQIYIFSSRVGIGFAKQVPIKFEIVDSGLTSIIKEYRITATADKSPSWNSGFSAYFYY